MDEDRHKGTEAQRDRADGFFLLCAFAALCLHRVVKTKLKSSPESEAFSHTPRGQ